MNVSNNKLPRFSVSLAGGLCLLTFIACEPDYGNLLTSPKDLPPSVFAFLNTTADSQYVILQNPIPLSGDYGDFLERDYQLYRQAIVTLADGAGDFVFHDKYEIIKASYADFPHDFVFVSAHRVQPKESYRLRVEVPQKAVYTASATTPGNFEILSHHAQDTLDVFNPVIIRWTASEDAGGYRVGLRWTVIDSSRLKLGLSEKLDRRKHVYVEPSAERVVMVRHELSMYYESPGAYSSETLGNDAAVFVEALDAPAWLAREINQRGGYVYGGPDEVRAMPASYSNIENGRGLMSAVTTRTIPLILPPREK
jgi:hypothetical protein